MNNAGQERSERASSGVSFGHESGEALSIPLDAGIQDISFDLDLAFEAADEICAGGVNRDELGYRFSVFGDDDTSCVFVYTRGMSRQLLAVSMLFPLFSCAALNQKASAPAGGSRATSTTTPLSLNSTTIGKGRTLLFLHGFGANSYTWSKISQSLAQNYRLIFLDLKGHGASPKPNDGAYSLHDQAELVSAFITDHGLEDVTLIGHSLGGGIALLVALKAASKSPNPISSLILVDSVAYSQRLPGFIKILRIPVLAQLLVRVVPNRFQALQVLRLAYHDPDKITDETIEAYSAPLSLPGAHNALIETAKQIIPDDIEEISSRYATIRMPTLLVWGRRDRIVNREVGERLHRAMPNSDLVVIDGIGHIPQEEAPAATLQAMQKFLQARP